MSKHILKAGQRIVARLFKLYYDSGLIYGKVPMSCILIKCWMGGAGIITLS